jgi:hypothetical protein
MTTPEFFGYLVEFDNVDDLIAGCETVRDAGYSKWDAHTPFVVHGLDRAMGIKPTILPKIVFVGGAMGTSLGILMQWWMNAIDYPYQISGKPLFSLPANIPVAFETTILFAAITTLLGMLALNKLPQHFHPLFTSTRFKRATDDRFFISIEAEDPQFDHEKTRELLSGLEGSMGVEEVEA